MDISGVGGQEVEFIGSRLLYLQFLLLCTETQGSSPKALVKIDIFEPNCNSMCPVATKIVFEYSMRFTKNKTGISI